MSQLNVIPSPDGSDKTTTAVRRHCRSCWREDLHFKVPIPAFIYGFLLIVSFGLIIFIRPMRCVCCGRMRII